MSGPMETDRSQPPVDPSPMEAGDDEFFERYGLRILISLRKIVRAIAVHSRKLNTEFKVTAPQMICLYCLRRRGPMILSDLAREVSLGGSTVNGIIDRLEAKGLVTRNRSVEDRRRVYVSVTDDGKRLTRAAPELLQDRLAESLRGLPDLEQAAIALSLERVVSLMGADDASTSPNLIVSHDAMDPDPHA